MNLKQLFGYATLEEAYHCAEILQAEGIECRLSHRPKGLLGDSATSDLTWISVPEADFERAKELLYPTADDAELKTEFQCPRCKSLKVRFDFINPKTGCRKVFTMPWDKEQFYCDDCKHIWERQPGA